MKTIDKCTLSDKELIEKAKELVSQLAKTGGKSWSLRVPVDFNNDPDMIFIELCKRLENSQQQVSIAVEKALQVAADKAKVNIWRNYPKIHDLDIINLTSHSEMGKDIIRVSKQSILSLAPQILEELKGGE